MMNSPYHIYIHAPWCRSKCPYCDFTVFVERQPPFEQWMAKIISDVQWTQQQCSWNPQGPSTIYFGGGTPSLVPAEYLKTIIDTLRTPKTSEITIEVNPGDVNPTTLGFYKEIGINRLSLGIQTFNRQHLKRLGRGNTPQDTRQLLSWVQDAGFDSWSMDLMFGLPNQTIAELESDLIEMLAFAPPHVSLYGLTYKEGTPLARAKNLGKIRDIDEDLWVDQFNLITQTLQRHGYLRYEVSNFCKPPHEAKHNQGIWKNEHYIGVGPGAHGFWTNGTRTHYPNTWPAWIEKSEPLIEVCTKEQQAIDWLITAIRHHQGIYLPRLKQFGYTLIVPPRIQQQPLFQQSLHIVEERWALSESGWIVVDRITEILVQALTPLNQHAE